MNLVIISLLIIFLGLIVWRPYLGGFIILAFLPAYLLRLAVAGIPTTWLELAIYLWAIVTVVFILQDKKTKPVLSYMRKKIKPLFWPLLLFMAAGLLSVFISPNLLKAAGAWKAWIFDALLFFVLFVYYYTAKDFQKIVLSLSGCLWLVSIWSLVEFIGGFGMQIPGFVNAMYQSANMVALLLVPMWFVLFGSAAALFFRQASAESLSMFCKKVFSDKVFIYLLVTLLIGALVIYLTRSYAGLLALFSGLLFFIIFIPGFYKRIKKVIFIIFTLAFFVAGAGLLQQGKLQKFFDDSSYNSWQTRQQIWHVAASLLQENYLLGIGFDSFEKRYYDRAFAIYHPPLEWEVPKAHNFYLNIWLEMGVLGLVSFIWLLIILARRLGYILQSAFHPDGSVSKDYFFTLGISLAFLSILVHGLFDTPYFKNDLSILWWVLFGLLLVFDNYKEVNSTNKA